jgi:hypothetical protein
MTNANFTSSGLQHNLIASEVYPEKSAFISKPMMMFQTRFAGIMEMYSDRQTVAEYLNDHQGWFIRCAEPMNVTPFGENGYTLTIGNYGAFGFDLEPQMTVILEQPKSESYSMYSVPNPQLSNSIYEVNYRSDLEIESIPVSQATKEIEKVYHQKGKKQLPDTITKINWQLDLLVNIQFPAFIYRLPMSMVNSTGNRVLREIVKQISPRLSYKVQKDFHTRLDLPIPPASSRTCQHLDSQLR